MSPTMLLDPPTYLASLQGNIRQRAIPWEGAIRANNLTEAQYASIRAVEKAKGPQQKKDIVERDLASYHSLFVGSPGNPSVLETAAKNANVIQYILVLLVDLTNVVPSLAHSISKSHDPYEHFLPLLRSNNAEDPIPLLTAHALSSLMAQSRNATVPTERALPVTFSYLAGLANSTDAGLQDMAVQEFSALLGNRLNRKQFWAQQSETIAPLIKILRAAANAGNGGPASSTVWAGTSLTQSDGSYGGPFPGLQLLYHVLLVMWFMSFDAETIGEELNSEYDIVVLYTQLLRQSQKEKTTRLILATLNRLLSTNQRSLLPPAIFARLPTALENTSSRHYTDLELLEDLEALQALVEEWTKTMTTFDEYVAEVETGHLRWSPPHRSQLFWAENARKILEYHGGEIPRKLAEIMSQPWENDKQVLAIVCNDIGCLVKEVPQKRPQLERLGLKTRIMELMGSEDENVRWESLRALGGWFKYTFEGM